MRIRTLLFLALAAALTAAVRAQQPAAATKPTVVKAGRLLDVRAGAYRIEHGDEATYEQFQAMREKGIVFVPTLWPRERLPISRTLSVRPDIEALVDAYIAGERTKLERARKAGVNIAFGSDMWFHYADKTRGQMTRVILESLQTAFGMTPADVLRSATVTAAELINMPNVSGAIEAGSFGDLIAVEGDPLAKRRRAREDYCCDKGRHRHARRGEFATLTSPFRLPCVLLQPCAPGGHRLGAARLRDCVRGA